MDYLLRFLLSYQIINSKKHLDGAYTANSFNLLEQLVKISEALLECNWKDYVSYGKNHNELIDPQYDSELMMRFKKAVTKIYPHIKIKPGEKTS